MLAVVTVVNAVHNAQQLQQRLNAELRAALDARSTGADAIRSAQGEFVDALAQSGPAGLADPAVTLALTHYRDSLHLDAQARARYPIPRATSYD